MMKFTDKLKMAIESDGKNPSLRESDIVHTGDIIHYGNGKAQKIISLYDGLLVSDIKRIHKERFNMIISKIYRRETI